MSTSSVTRWPFQKVLVVNRGEIAVRIIRACRELGLRSVAVYSDADRNALHVRMADEAYHIGPAVAARSYLHIPTLIEVAKRSGAQAVHPGYGFLSENASFVEACRKAGLIFVGPPPESQKSMGEKTAARRVYLEKAISPARHIEVQFIADTHGNVVHLGERECSVQRRHQKLVEEAPSPIVDAALRERMTSAAINLVRSINYVNAGTAEFLVGPDRNFYFLEVNARIQVEHPVTELCTGVDIVQEQFRVAAGLPLSFTQEQIELRGSAIECRISAEDPENRFLPATGMVH